MAGPNRPSYHTMSQRLAICLFLDYNYKFTFLSFFVFYRFCTTILKLSCITLKIYSNHSGKIMNKHKALKWKWKMKQYYILLPSEWKKKHFKISRAKLFSWFKFQYMYKFISALKNTWNNQSIINSLIWFWVKHVIWDGFLNLC